MFILPLWELVGGSIPNIGDFVDSIEKNRNQWELLEYLDN